MDNSESDLAALDFEDAEALWEAFAGSSVSDVLAREAFERELRFAAGLEDEDLYFRPGGWTVDLPLASARVAVVAAVLAAAFHLAGLEDLDREIIIAAAGLVASMEVRPVRLGRHDQHLADRLRQAGLAGTPVSATDARRALSKKRRRQVSSHEIADAMDRLVSAGLADHAGDDAWIVRAQGSEAWIRIGLPSS